MLLKGFRYKRQKFVYVSDITYNISVTKRIWRKMRKGREVNDLVFLLLSLGNDSIAVKNCTVCGT